MGLPAVAVVAPLAIHLMGDKFEVFGVHATPVPTEVITFQPLLNWPYQSFIRDVVALTNLALPTKYAIAFRVAIRYPFPAAISKNMDFRPEARREPRIAEGRSSRMKLHRKLTPFVAMPSGAHTSRRLFVSIIAHGDSV